MPPQPELEEENWDDDFDFGSSSGSPVLGSFPRSGAVTPPNLSHTGSGSRQRTKSPDHKAKNRLSDASSLNWDDEDETINFKSFAASKQQEQLLSTPKPQRTVHNVPFRESEEYEEPRWDDEEDEIAPPSRNAPSGVIPTSPNVISSINQPLLSTPSSLAQLNGSTTDTSSIGVGNSSASSVIQPSDVSNSTTSSFFGKLGRRLSKAGSTPGTKSNSMSPDVSIQSGLSSTTFSPPASSNSLTTSVSNVLGNSPSKSRNLFAFGLKRNGSLSRSGNGSTNSTTQVDNQQTNDAKVGLGVQVPKGTNGDMHSAPAIFNAQRYTERIDPSISSSHLQHSSHLHTQSTGIVATGWGRPPSPTRAGKGTRHSSLGGNQMLTDLLSKEKPSKQGENSTFVENPVTAETEPQTPNSSSFFSSLRRRSNPLQVAAKVPKSAMTGTPQPTTSPRSGGELSDPSQGNAKVDSTTAPRPKRTHRRNISTGAMITSVIDEVSSDATVNNKLVATRDRAPAQRSGLSQSTTLDLTSARQPRLSTSSISSGSIPPVSPVEFSRSSEESSDRKPGPSAFSLPGSMSIKSPLLSSQSTIPTNQLPKIKSPNKGTELGQDSTLSGLLPPIDLSSQSSPMALGNRSSSTILERRINKRSEKKPATPEEDNDRTPVALPRRVHRLQLSDGTIVRAPSRSNESLDRLATDALTNVMDSLTNLPISNSNSSRTISAMAQHGTKQSDTINGRASPGISASLGRLTGTTTAEKIDDKITTSNSSTGIGRRNSFTAGTASTNISSSKSLGGGLKIPARIQQQQEALKRDLIAVREFAMSIDELKRLQLNHGLALVELKRLSEPQAVSPEPSKQAKTHVARSSITKRISGSQPSSPTTTTFAQAFSFARRERHVLEAPGSESHAPVDEASLIPEDQKIVTRAALAELNAHYAIWWECADLLIELGGAAPAAAAGTPVRSPTMPTLRRPEANESQSTPRASQRQSKTTNATPNVASITSTDPTSASRERRGSTGQQDLSIRQVQLLKDMLSTPDPNDLASNIDARLNREAPFSVLSPVISHGGSTVRTQATIPTIDSQASEDAIASAAEKEKKRGRRVSALAGKLGVKDILAGLKWAKEKALQRSRQTKSAEATTPPGVTGDAQRTDSSTRRSKENIASASQVTLDLQPAASKTSLAVADAPQVNDPPSPYKRSRRRSLASIFKFGNASTTQTVDQSSTRSKSRIDLTSPTFPSEHNGAVWDQNQGDHGHESDWDQLNSPSDVPGRNTYVHRGQNSNTDLLQSSNVRNLSSNGIPIPTGRRRGSTASRDASVSRYGYSSASASAASLANSSVYGSAASHFSLHESMSGRVSQGQHEEDRRRLKKPPSKTPRRPPSASGRKSKRSFSRGSPTGQVTSPITSTVTSPNLDQSYRSPRSSSRHSHVTESGSGVPMLPSSTRSAPLAQSQSLASLTDLSQPRLALTPENIVPLLVYAKEVRLKLADCLMELKALESDLLLSKPSEDDDLLDNRGVIEIETGGTRW